MKWILRSPGADCWRPEGAERIVATRLPLLWLEISLHMEDSKELADNVWLHAVNIRPCVQDCVHDF